MNQSKIQNFLIQNVSNLEGVGIKTKKLLRKKKIEKITDFLGNLPQGFTDRSNIQTLNNLEIGKVTTVRVKVTKHNFPRIRNLPDKVNCEDENGKIDIVFFNCKEGYIRKILPLNSSVVISGKINFYKKRYQITNPAYIVPISKEDYINRKLYHDTKVYTNLSSTHITDDQLKHISIYDIRKDDIELAKTYIRACIWKRQNRF